MNDDQTERYLREMYGTKRGYVAMAAKKGTGWSEKVFAWPRERKALESWVDAHADGNVFICPALRASRKREKGDGIGLRWLWADVDWDKVPASRRERVKMAIAKVGTRVVSSGTGDNAHVYVRLTTEVTPEEHMRLNTGLRNLLYADAKHADNSLLRLPGTTNRKTTVGAPVEYRAGVKAVAHDPQSLLRVREFAAVTLSTPATGGTAVPWSKVDVSTVMPRARRWARMTEDEAKGRFNGKRHSAVWGVVGDMFKAGLTDDEIHTLMDDFPPAVAKAMDEHDGYDVHADVDRRLSTLRHAQAIVDGTDVHTTHDDDDNPFEELTDAEIREMGGADNPRVRKLLEEREARRMADQIEAERTFVAPPADVSWSADERNGRPRVEVPYLIESLCGAKQNAILTAQYKTGKTQFLMASLARSLCDGVKFLDRFAVPEDGKVVGHWNCEMDDAEIFELYIQPAGFKHPERLHVANLVGYGVNILSSVGKAWAVAWLESRGVQVWTIDSLARLARMAGVDENDNVGMMALFMAVDEIKVAAGVDVTFTIAHTGRAEMAEGRERARAATVIDDWPGARWVMTRDGDDRFLHVEGRGVYLKTTVLDYNHDTGVSTLGVGDKHDVRTGAQVHAVAEIVRANVGLNAGQLIARIKSVAGLGAKNDARARALIQECEEMGLIRIEKVPGGRGGNPSHKHYPVIEGEKRGNATARKMNLSRAGDGPRGRKST